jgi:hypothetical protein
MIIFMPKLSADCTPGAMLCALGYALPLQCIEGRSNVIECILKRFAQTTQKISVGLHKVTNSNSKGADVLKSKR